MGIEVFSLHNKRLPLEVVIGLADYSSGRFLFRVFLIHFAHYNSCECTISLIVAVAQRVEVSSLHPSIILIRGQLQSSFMQSNQTLLILDSLNIEKGLSRLLPVIALLRGGGRSKS